LGLIDQNNRKFQAFLPSLKDIIQVSTGSYHSLALNNLGQIFSFGSNYVKNFKNNNKSMGSLVLYIFIFKAKEI
jgi:alpha-tubulin suppressor-like RCC1 family protein